MQHKGRYANKKENTEDKERIKEERRSKAGNLRSYKK